jgi:hypothetical protein
LQAAIYVLKDVGQEQQQKFNKIIKIHCQEFLEKGEEISMRNLHEIYEDRLMSVKRANELPEQMVTEALEDWEKTSKQHEEQASRQKETAAATGRASIQPLVALEAGRTSQHQSGGSSDIAE